LKRGHPDGHYLSYACGDSSILRQGGHLGLAYDLELCAGSSLWAVPVAVGVALIGGLTQRVSSGKWRGTWITALAGAIGGPAVVIVAGFLVNLVRYPAVREAELLSQIPQRGADTLAFQYDGRDPFLKLDNDGTLWVRVRAINKSTQDLVCRVFLNSLEKEGEAEPLWSSDDSPLELYWTDTQRDLLETSRIVAVGGGEVFNIAKIAKDASVLSIQRGQFAAQTLQKLSPGTYKFVVQASHSRPCRSATIVVRYNGQQNVSFKDQTSGR
jgi:hypothetical protein